MFFVGRLERKREREIFKIIAMKIATEGENIRILQVVGP